MPDDAEDDTEDDTGRSPDAGDAAAISRSQRRRPPHRVLALLVAPIIGLIVASNVGDALATTLATTHPLTLIFLNSRSRNLVLVTNQLDALSYYGVATLRLLVSDPLFFLLGYWYGESAVRWMEKRTRSLGGTMRQVERWFGRSGLILVFIAPNNLICLMAGAAGMRVSLFLAANLAGTLVRLYLIRRVGEAFDAPIQDLLGFLADYRVPLLIVSVVLVAASTLWELRHDEGELEAVLHLDEDLEADEDVGSG
ncbi:MAG: DedA family protein [Microthrixaceae bacterium]